MEYIYDDGGRSKYFKAQNVGDCAVRAIAIGTGKDYKEVYDALKELNKGKSCRNGTPKKVDSKYLSDLGWTKLKGIMELGSGIQYHVCEEDLNKLSKDHPIMIIQVSHHLFCVKDGIIRDTYDCSRGGSRGIYAVWVPPTEESKRIQDIMEFNKQAKQAISAQMNAELKVVREKYNKQINTLKRAKNKEITKVKKLYAKKLVDTLLDMGDMENE